MSRHSIDPNDVIHVVKNEVRFHRGYGETGMREVIVSYKDTDLSDHGHNVTSCHCGYDRCKVIDDRHPEFPIPLEYECMACSRIEVEEIEK